MGYAKHYSKEDILQGNCVRWFVMQFPDLSIMHAPNEGKRTPFEQARLNFVGQKKGKGFPDLIIFDTTLDGSKGLAIELKVVYRSGKKNKPTKEQLDWLQRLENSGFKAFVVYTIKEFISIVRENYLKKS